MAKRKKQPRVNRRDLTLQNLHAYQKDLKLFTEALKGVDKRLHDTEELLARLIRGEVSGHPLTGVRAPTLQETDSLVDSPQQP